MNVLTPSRGGKVIAFTFFLSLFLFFSLSTDAQVAISLVGEPEITVYPNLEVSAKKQRKRTKEIPVGPISSEELSIQMGDSGRSLTVEINRKKWKESLKLRVLRADKTQMLMGMFSEAKQSLQFPIDLLSEGHYYLEITDHQSVYLQKIEVISDDEAR
ncbi:MAG: hypothetical protein AAF598_14025 [Bacteroidota bacterium]